MTAIQLNEVLQLARNKNWYRLFLYRPPPDTNRGWSFLPSVSHMLQKDIFPKSHCIKYCIVLKESQVHAWEWICFNSLFDDSIIVFYFLTAYSLYQRWDDVLRCNTFFSQPRDWLQIRSASVMTQNTELIAVIKSHFRAAKMKWKKPALTMPLPKLPETF